MKTNVMKFIPKTVSLKVGKSILLGRKNSPTILFGLGVVGVVATAVLSARATLKLEDLLEDTQDSLESATALHRRGRKDYSDVDYKKDVTIIYVRCVGSITKLYGPALTVGVLTISSLAGSHSILTKRNAGLMAAYATLSKGFDEYRQRVLEEVGPEKERELRYGSETREIIEDTKNGPKVSIVKSASRIPSVYAKWFDDTNKEWVREAEYNILFLNLQQNWANEILRAKGYIFLNEVYDMLGMEPTKAGQVVGWLISKETDNFVSFGTYDSDNPEARSFVNGRENSILLDFNVDVIYDKIGKEI